MQGNNFGRNANSVILIILPQCLTLKTQNILGGCYQTKPKPWEELLGIPTLLILSRCSQAQNKYM